MRLTRAIWAPFLSFVLAAVLIAPLSSSQPGEGGVLRLAGDLSISGISPLAGSGNVEITYEGDAATGLRLDMFNTYDLNGDEYLDQSEARAFLNTVSAFLVGKIYWGASIDSATNWNDESNSYIEQHTSGILFYKWDATVPISFDISYEFEGEAQTKVIFPAQSAYDSFAMAVAQATGYIFNGTLEIEQQVASYVIGSFTNPNMTGGSMSEVREPLGSFLWYSYSGHVGPGQSAEDQITYEVFSLKENQQLSFAVLLFGCILILRMPGKNFDKYEKLHPKKFRKYAKPLMSVTVSAWVLAAVLVILYLFPYIFSFVSPNTILYAAYLYILVPVAVVAEYFFAKTMYAKAQLAIPDESIIEVKQAVVEPEEGAGEILCKVCYRPIEAGLEMLQCGNCGANLHADCGEKAQNCPECGQMLFPERERSIECKACGESFIYAGAEDPYSIQCPKCGAFQEEISPGKNYLVAADDPKSAFMMIRSMAVAGRPTLCMTTQFPGKIRSEYELGNEVAVKWFSDSSTDIDNINPKDLEGDSMEVVSTFLMTTKSAGVLIEGMETLVELNGFDKALAFVKRVNDLAAIHGSTVILAMNKKKVTDEQFRIIGVEFDETHDYQ